MSYVDERFILNPITKRHLRSLNPDFGFDGVGAIVYYRSYSRLKLDGSQEHWADTIIRVVEGVMAIRKDWYSKNGIQWDENHWQTIANRMALAMFHMRFLPPGRGLFAVGSDYLFERGSAAAYNCAAVSVTDNLSGPAEWTTDLLMNGVGVGFDTHKGTFSFTHPTEQKRTFVIPDTREGWAESIGLLLESYEQPQHPTVVFDYSHLRPAGAPIKSFGGQASGPEPLREAHELIRDRCNAFTDGVISRVELITDVMNIIGTAVIAGNTRRSAEISLGSPSDDNFRLLKDFTTYLTDDDGKFVLDDHGQRIVKHQGTRDHRAGWGWMSNNSISLETEEDFKYLPDIANNIRLNGEPGVMNLLNIQKYGRIGDEMPDAAHLCNPCAEIPLESYETCNLSEVFPTRCATEAEYFEALELATLYSSTIALLPTHRPETNAVIERNRRIGVSISGIAGWYDNIPATTFIRLLRQGYKHVRAENARLAREAGVPTSVRVTTIKPSGSISLVAGVSPGMHYPVYSTYLRRIRVGKNAPIADFMIQAGLPYEEDIKDSGTWVFAVPTQEKARRGQKDISLWQKASMVKILQRNYADNMVSNTLTFDPDTEGDQLEDVLGMFIQDVKTFSFLPDNDKTGAYEQAPYEKLTQDQYKKLRKGIRKIDWTEFGGSDGQDSRFCSNAECEL